MSTEQIDELEVFNAGVGAGIDLATKYAWTRWNEATDEVPEPETECVGIWIHKTKRSNAGCHAECFVYREDHNGFLVIDGMNDTNLRSGLNPDYWIPMPGKGV